MSKFQARHRHVTLFCLDGSRTLRRVSLAADSWQGLGRRQWWRDEPPRSRRDQLRARIGREAGCRAALDAGIDIGARGSEVRAGSRQYSVRSAIGTAVAGLAKAATGKEHA